MNNWPALFKKELLEQVRTYRFLITAGIFVFFGLTTPVMLKYLPQIIQLSGQSIPVEIPPPAALDSLIEFSGTILQLGILIMILVGMGSVAGEYKQGTILMVLSKPVSRTALVSAKVAALSTSMLASLLAAALLSYAYTVWLIGPADFGKFMLQNGLLALFLVFVISLTVLFSSLFKSGLAAGGVTLAVVIFQALLSALPGIGDFLPGRLPGWGIEILNGQTQTYWWALGLNLLLIFICVYLSQLILKRKEA